MPIAQPETCGIEIAVRSPGVTIPEIAAVDLGSRLSDADDVHFGMNSTAFDQKLSKKSLRGLGPRALDIAKRGGRTAEDTWRHLGKQNLRISCNACQADLTENYGVYAAYNTEAAAAEIYQGDDLLDEVNVRNQSHLEGLECLECDKPMLKLYQLSKQRPAVQDFQGFFDNFNAGKKVRAGKERLPAGARIKGKAVSGDIRYTGTTKLDCEGIQYGIRWSKTALEHVLARKQGKIHFHLDGMGSIDDILAKKGDYSHNVTSTELRYVRKNWSRFEQYTVFYNGYTATDRAVIVRPPW